MKKFCSIITIALSLAVVLGCAVAKAYSNPTHVVMCMSGVTHSGFDVKTDYYTKDRGGVQQVYLSKASTSLTNPCPKCQVAFKLFMDDGTAWTGAAAKMGETQSMFGDSQWRGNYQLGMMRADFTLLKTDVEFDWSLNV